MHSFREPKKPFRALPIDSLKAKSLRHTVALLRELRDPRPTLPHQPLVVRLQPPQSLLQHRRQGTRTGQESFWGEKWFSFLEERNVTVFSWELGLNPTFVCSKLFLPFWLFLRDSGNRPFRFRKNLSLGKQLKNLQPARRVKNNQGEEERGYDEYPTVFCSLASISHKYFRSRTSMEGMVSAPSWCMEAGVVSRRIPFHPSLKEGHSGN